MRMRSPCIQQWWQSFLYAGEYYLIGNAWSNIRRGDVDFHQKALAKAHANPTPDNEEIFGEVMASCWFDLISQASRVADLAGRLNKTNMNFFHQVGMVAYINSGAKPKVNFDVGGVSGYSSTLDYDFTQLAITNTVVAMRGVALEAASSSALQRRYASGFSYHCDRQGEPHSECQSRRHRYSW
ncbi:MAG: hypothetical protein IPL73_21090 [Candidatus Obscuribacter sp.]|nr:hypothetical protein [Candidatus Obscuribacter sp.]